ncbi:hypothetical protein DFH06DRAFT_1127372 [Mycena polygramma]|nr:hypothetical protein DFH06DRAFT_1127372 [Mycena polygramma]
MTMTVPLSALATSADDTDATQLGKRYLFPKNNALIFTIEPKHERSILEIRKSMETLPGSDDTGWTLVPTEETLIAMDVLQTHNITASISERKSFLTEFSAAQYEYIFVPLNTEAEFCLGKPLGDSALPIPTFLWSHHQSTHSSSHPTRDSSVNSTS